MIYRTNFAERDYLASENKKLKHNLNITSILLLCTAIWAAIFTSLYAIQQVGASYAEYKAERAACMVEAEKYETAWCDDYNNLVK